ncbi:MAG: hypothetical protein AAGU11_12900, partial [Syntrophobacteraceae bacterium]
ALSDIKKFWDAFLWSVKSHGRLFETGVLAGYIARTGKIFTDLDLGPRIAPKGKLALLPHSIKGKDQVARIFERFNRINGQ